MRFYIEENHALPVVSLAVALRTGSATDPAGKDGLTRITSRMLRRGCKGLKSHEVEERIDSLGAELVFDVSPGIVTIHADVIARSLDSFVDLLVRILSEPTFDADETARLLREAQGEQVEVRDNDRALAARYFRKTMFDGHPYGRRGSGLISTLSTITQSDVQKHYLSHFTGADAFIAFSGDVTEERARAIAERLTSALPKRDVPAVEIPEPAPRPGRRLVFVDKPERTQTQVMIGTLGVHPREPAFVPLQVATTIFGGTFTSRLMKEIRSKRGWSYGANARLGFERTRDAFTIWTFPAAKDAAACIALELELYESWHTKGILPRELSFVQKYIVRSHAFDIDTAEKRVHEKLDIDLLDLPADFHSGYTDHVRAVTVESANHAVASLLSTRDLVIAVVGTHSEIGDAVARAIPDLAEVQVVPFDVE